MKEEFNFLSQKKRILIVGNCGSGKSTFSKLLQKKLGLEVYHLDKYFWKPNWEKRETEEWIGIIEKLISNDKWIIEGNYSNTFSLRAKRADFIYFFDFPVWFCLYRIYKRGVKEKFEKERRFDLADGCEGSFPNSIFAKFVFRFNKVIRPRIYSIIDELNFDRKNLIIFRTKKEFAEYCRSLMNG